jgi:lipopolysaccharide exporter
MTEQPLRRAGSALIWRAAQMGGTKVIFLVRLLVLAYLLTPDDFGLVTIGVSAVGFLLSVTDFGLVEALIHGRTIDDRRYNAAWTVNLTRSLFVCTLVFIGAPLVASIFGEPRVVNVIRVLALRPLLDALASIKVHGLTRELNFRPLALLKLADTSINTIVSIVLAIRFGVWGLVTGTLAGSLAYLIASYLVAPHRPRLLFARDVARPLLEFGRWIYFTGLVAMLGANVFRVAITRQLGTAELGLYYLATQIAYLPAEVASEVVGSVAFPLYARLQANLQTAAEAFRVVFTSTAYLLFPISTVIIAVAPTLVDEVLDAKWAGSAPIIGILTLASVIGLFGDATVPIFQGLGQPSRITLLEIVQSALLAVLVWQFTRQWGLAGAAAAWIPAISVSQFISYLFMRRIFGGLISGFVKPISALVTVCVAGVVIATGLDRLSDGLLGLVFTIAVSALSMIGIFLLIERHTELGPGRYLIQLFPRLTFLVGKARTVEVE